MNKIVVIFKTHIWNNDIEIFSKKIYTDCFLNNIDFFIIYNDKNPENSIIIEDDKLKNIILIILDDEFKNIYDKGFINFRYSNHWLLMWFYQKYNNYQYYWSIEYDVRISGDSSKIWLYNEDYDFLFTIGNYQNSKNKHFKYYIGNLLNINNIYCGYLQLARYSNNVLKYLHEKYLSGENCQDELITFSLIRLGKFTYSNIFLKKLINGHWTWILKYSIYNKKLYEISKINNYLHIYHPIK